MAPTNHTYYETGTVRKKGDNWEPEYDNVEQWEVLLSDLIYGMVVRANGSISEVEAMNYGKRKAAEEKYGDQFTEILHLAQRCRNL